MKKILSLSLLACTFFFTGCMQTPTPVEKIEETAQYPEGYPEEFPRLGYAVITEKGENDEENNAVFVKLVTEKTTLDILKEFYETEMKNLGWNIQKEKFTYPDRYYNLYTKSGEFYKITILPQGSKYHIDIRYWKEQP